MGVPAAKSIRLIMEELASRKKESTEQKTQSSSTTSGRGRSQVAQVRTIVLQEQLEQKNRIEEEEGDGEIPSDCVEGTEEEVTSPRTEVLYKMYRETAESFLSRPLRHLSNLRMQSGLPGFRVEPLHFSLEPVLVNGEEEKGQHQEVYEEEGENNQLQALVGTKEGRGKKGEYVSQNVGDDDDQIGVNKAGDHENYPAYSYVKRWEEVR